MSRQSTPIVQFSAAVTYISLCAICCDLGVFPIHSQRQFSSGNLRQSTALPHCIPTLLVSERKGWKDSILGQQGSLQAVCLSVCLRNRSWAGQEGSADRAEGWGRKASQRGPSGHWNQWHSGLKWRTLSLCSNSKLLHPQPLLSAVTERRAVQTGTAIPRSLAIFLISAVVTDNYNHW